MQDFLLGGLLLVISTYIILKLLEDVLPVLLSEHTDRGLTRNPRRSKGCTGTATRSRRSRKSSDAHGRARISS